MLLCGGLAESRALCGPCHPCSRAPGALSLSTDAPSFLLLQIETHRKSCVGLSLPNPLPEPNPASPRRLQPGCTPPVSDGPAGPSRGSARVCPAGERERGDPRPSDATLSLPLALGAPPGCVGVAPRTCACLRSVPTSEHFKSHVRVHDALGPRRDVSSGSLGELAASRAGTQAPLPAPRRFHLCPGGKRLR